MRLNRIIFAAIAVSAFATGPAQGAVFSGTLYNTNPPASPSGRCAPTASTVSISPSLGASVGASNIGAFSATMSHCINPPLPTSYSNGIFSFDFGAGDLLTGTYDGVLSASGTAGVFDNLESYIVTGGTGRFANFAGSLTGTGTVTFAPGSLPASQQSITGNIGAVPEPTTWAMMLIGFGAIGVSFRRRRTAREAMAS